MRSELRRRYERTEVFSDFESFEIPPGSVFVHGAPPSEERSSALISFLESKGGPRVVLSASAEDPTSAQVVTVDGCPSLSCGHLSLRDPETFLDEIGSNDVYVDITSLPLGISASLIRGGLERGASVHAMYVQPIAYAGRDKDAKNPQYALNHSFLGIGPLPTFGKIFRSNENCRIIVQLGFDGARATAILAEYDPLPPFVVMVGAPGFQLGFPSESIDCNRAIFRSSRPASVLFAPADCPFAAMWELEAMMRDSPDDYMIVAPIGTKPQALGAILFALSHSNRVEIVYDHPVRQPTHSSGVGPLHVFRLTGIL